jgi:hypothetical protein
LRCARSREEWAGGFAFATGLPQVTVDYSAGMNEERVLPVGDIHFDGEHLSINGEIIAPGRYTIPGVAAELVVNEDEPDDTEGDHVR